MPTSTAAILPEPLCDVDILSLILQRLPEGLAVCAEDMSVLYWNGQAEAITGCSIEDVRAGMCRALLNGEETGSGPRGQRRKITRKNGREATVSVQRAELADAAGRKFTVVCFADISDSVYDEDAVEMVNQLLFDAAQRMQDLASIDGLTGLLNRRVFLERAQGEISRMRRHRDPLSLLMFDIDHFKKCNDTFGHPFGDRVLYSVGQTAQSICRKEDILARYGGEEFVLFLPDTPIEGARLLAERLRKAIESLVIQHMGVSSSVTISCGVSTLTADDTIVRRARESHRSAPTDQALVNQLIAHADQALYRAKSAGRNRVETYRTA